jgi:predicted porin
MTRRKSLNYLIALSLIAPVPALADTANVSLYGVANVSYDIINTGAATGVQGTNINKASSNASRIGLKGTEDLGDGLTANWQIETLIVLDNSANACAKVTAADAAATGVPACTANTGIFATRNSFAGLSSKTYGAVLVGRYDTPYKLSTRKLDNFSDSIGDNRSLFGTVSGTSASAAFDGRQPDVIAYTSPLMAGFSAAVAQVNLAESATTSTAAKASATSLAGMYDDGSLYAALAYETHKLDTVRIGGKESAWRAGLGYTMDDLSFGMAYEKSSDTLGGATAPTSCTALAAGADCLGHDAWYLTGKYTFDANAVKFAYTKVGNLGSTNDTGANQFALGYDRRLSKRTTLFTVYTKLANESKAKYSLGNAAFSSGVTASIGAGADASALSFGLKHAF